MMVSISPDLDIIHFKKSIIAKSFPIKSQRSITNLKMENGMDFFDDSYNSENCFDLFTKHQIKYINFSCQKSALKLQIEDGDKSFPSKYPLGIENTLDDLKNFLCQQHNVDKRLIRAFINNENRDEIPSDADLKTIKETVVAFIFPIDTLFVDSLNHSYPYLFKFPMKLNEIIPEIKSIFGLQAEEISFSINDKIVDANSSIYSILKNQQTSQVTIFVSEKAELNKIDVRCLIESQYVTIKFPFFAEYSFRDVLSIIQIYFDVDDPTMQLSIEDNEDFLLLDRPVRACNLEKTKYLTLTCDSQLKLRRFYRINSNGPLEQIIIHPSDRVDDIIDRISSNVNCSPSRITLMFVCKGKECILDRERLFTYYFIPFKQELIAKIGETNSSPNRSKSRNNDSRISNHGNKTTDDSSAANISRKMVSDSENELSPQKKSSTKNSNQLYKLKLKIHQKERLAESEVMIDYSPQMKIESIYNQNIPGLTQDSFFLYHNQKIEPSKTFQLYGINGDDLIDVYSSEFLIFENHIGLSPSQIPKMVPLVLHEKISYPKIRSHLNLGSVDFFLECNEELVADGCFSDNFAFGSIFIIEKVRMLNLSITYLGKPYKLRFDCRKRANEVISALADKIHKDPETIQLFNMALNTPILPEERLYKHFHANSNNNEEFEMEAREMRNMSFMLNEQTEEFFFLTSETIGELKVYLKDNFESVQNLTGLYIVYNGQLHANKETISDIFAGATSSDEPFLIFNTKPDEITVQFIFNINQLTVEKAFVNCDVRMIKGVKIQNVRKVAAQMISVDDPEQIVLRSTKDGKELIDDDEVLNENIEIATSLKDDDEHQLSPKKFSEIQSKIESMNEKRKTPQSEKKKKSSVHNDDSNLSAVKTTKRSASVISKSKTLKNNTSKDSSFSTPRRTKPQSRLSEQNDSIINEKDESAVSQNTSKPSSAKKKTPSSKKLKINSPYKRIPATQPKKEKKAATPKKEQPGISSSASTKLVSKASTQNNESPRVNKSSSKIASNKAQSPKDKSAQKKSEAKSSPKSDNLLTSQKSSNHELSANPNKKSNKSTALNDSHDHSQKLSLKPSGQSSNTSSKSSRKSSPKSSAKSSRVSSPKSSRVSSAKSSPVASAKSSRVSSAKSSRVSSAKSSRVASAKSSRVSSPKSSRVSSAKSSPRNSPKSSRNPSPSSLKKGTKGSHVVLQASKKRSLSQAGRRSHLSNRSASKVTISQIPQKSKRSQSFSGKNSISKSNQVNFHSVQTPKCNSTLKSSFKIDSSFSDKSTSFTEINLSNDHVLYSESMIQNESDTSCINDLGKGNGIYWPIKPGSNDYIFKFRGFDNGRSFKLLLPKDATVQHVQQRVAEERRKQGTPTEPENVNVHLGMMILQEDIVLRSISIPDDIDYFSISYKYGENLNKKQSLSTISEVHNSTNHDSISSPTKETKTKKKKMKSLKKK